MTFILPSIGGHLAFGYVAAWGGGLHSSLEKLSEQFDAAYRSRASEMGLGGVVARGLFVCNVAHILDDENYWLVGEVARGAPFPRKFPITGQSLTEDDIERAAVREIGFVDPFYAKLPRSAIDLLKSEDEKDHQELQLIIVKSIDELFGREYQRVVSDQRRIRLNPLFGALPLEASDLMCFVIAPFSDERTAIFREYIQPTVEQFGLACIRVDSVQSNRGIVENIWRSICEARFIVADLTGANPNVFYELGIAHTVGKDVILIEERPADGPAPKRPFDTMGINAIIYQNSAVGGSYLRDQLASRIDAIMNARVLPNLPVQSS